MPNAISLFETVFKRNFTGDGNGAYLEQLAADHPYFTAAQFYLLEQCSENSGNYEQQAARTALLFNNPHWLNLQLQQARQLPEEQPELLPEPATVQIQTPETLDRDEEEQPAPDEKELEPMNFTLKLPEEPDNKKDESMLFEPMHLVDYFASQGIKLNEEVQPADKLGQQLKSFTEWLKTMKKVHTDKEVRETVATELSDIAVQNLAEKSNTEGEVLTEAMAEVFAMQGKNGKAREVYEKLSLLNPSKSAYFAAKIELLKGS